MSDALQRPQVVEPLDYERILAAIKADVVRLYPQAAAVIELESEPLNALAQAFAYRELLYRARVNDAALAQYIETAQGSDLDHKADFYGVARLPDETDARLRQRLRLRIAALAGNGTAQAYEARALAAHPGVRQARAYARADLPGAVTVMLWPAPGADAQAARAAVQAALDAAPDRILGVPVQAVLARPVAFAVRARVELTQDAPADVLARLQDVLRQAVADWPLGRDKLRRSWLASRLYIRGVAGVAFPVADEPPETLRIGAGEYPELGNVEIVQE